MTRRRRKLLTLAAALVAVVATVALWLRPRGYTYQGKTVEEWFEDASLASALQTRISSASGLPFDERSWKAFQQLGTNAAPFLASRITRDFQPPLLERIASRLPNRFRPRPRQRDAYNAAYLLRRCIRPPENMLRQLLKPALLSTNLLQKNLAQMALQEAQGFEESPLK